MIRLSRSKVEFIVDVYSTEQDQLKALRRWWQENGKAVVGGIVIGLAIIIGGRIWMQHRGAQAETASVQFELMITALEQGRTDVALDHSAGLIGQYADTPYAALAALNSAKIKLEQGDNGAARAHLQWALDNAEQDEIRHIARLRMARILFQDGALTRALETLNQTETRSFEASYEAIKGDIFVAMKNFDKARLAYTKALDNLDLKSGDRSLLQMKRDDLGAVGVTVGAIE